MGAGESVPDGFSVRNTQVAFASFEDGGRGHEPRSADGL